MPDLSTAGAESLAAWLLLGSAVLVVVLVVAVLVIRVLRWVADAADQRRSTWAREVLFRVLEGDDVRAPWRRARRHALAATAARLSTKLRGADRATLATWLTQEGFRQHAVEMMHSQVALTRARGARMFVACLADRETRPLLDLLGDRDVRVRSAAARALGECGIDTAVPFLVRAAQSDEAPLPVSVAAMSIVHAAPRSARSLGLAWQSDRPEVAAMAAEVAGFLHLTDARVPLEHAVAHDDPAVADAAAWSLARLGDPRSATPIEKRLRKHDLPVLTQRSLHGAYAELHHVRLEP
ncbi:HEAT repeat domain-containing protein [Demequina sp. NBRC 110051]|uniref:HEAT repeat domain-containing protein n=1 Tax=Demequina sp. NBRC 110051 TaxID=1570340 RepID=UPI000A01B778|nr:HEAT repeat domain-containing protein [Demequina sp. NBRC 110051]